MPVQVNDNGYIFDTLTVAGSVGMNCSSSGEELAVGKKWFDTVAAQTGWWMFEIKSTKRESTKEVPKMKMKGVLDDDSRY